MGSLKQISLASLCLGAAVVFWNVVNRPPEVPVSSDAMAAESSNSESSNSFGSNVRSRVSTDEFDLAESRPAPIATMRHRTQPAFALEEGTPLPNAKDDLPLPPPSQLADNTVTPKSETPDPTEADRGTRDLVSELPDFSAIAAELDDSPIALRPLGTMPTLERRANEAVARTETPAPQSVLRLPAGIEESAIQTSDTYQVVGDAVGFTSKDFETRLRGGDQAPPVMAKRPGAVVSMIPPAQAMVTEPSIAPVDSGVPSTSNRIRTMLPFGLTDGAKSELVELHSRASVNLALETTEFVDHVVQPGETLQSISKRYFGKPDYYLDIYLANRGKLRNPAHVPTGTLVKVPVYNK